MTSPKRILISGCSGGGKSTLVAALAKRGFATVPEPGRRIIAAQRRALGTALPWIDMTAFAQHALDMARADLVATNAIDGPVFFDRGLVDAAAALAFETGLDLHAILSNCPNYDPRVYLAPPWPALFANDAYRQHSFAEAEAEYKRLEHAFDVLGYQTRLLPKAPVTDRMMFLLTDLRAGET